MKREFKSALSEGRTVEVSTYGRGANLYIRDSGIKLGISIGQSDVPALCLAITDAAGIVRHDPEDTPHDSKQRTTNMGDVNIAAFHLAQHVTRAAKIALIQAEEAAAQAALWQEASDLYHSCFPDNPAYESAEKMPEHLRDGWVRVALKAREINGASDA